MKHTMIRVDLAKEVIQVCTYRNKHVHSNKELTHKEFLLKPGRFSYRGLAPH